MMTYLAYSGVVEEILQWVPFLVLALGCFLLERVLLWREITFEHCWWFLLLSFFVVIAEAVWTSWVASTRMEEILMATEQALGLKLAILTYLGVSGLLMAWMVWRGVRQVITEMKGTGVEWGLVRLIPVVVFFVLLVPLTIHGNASIGEEGLFQLMGF